MCVMVLIIATLSEPRSYVNTLHSIAQQTPSYDVCHDVFTTGRHNCLIMKRSPVTWCLFEPVGSSSPLHPIKHGS